MESRLWGKSHCSGRKGKKEEGRAQRLNAKAFHAMSYLDFIKSDVMNAF